jgi:hypothetical protein
MSSSEFLCNGKYYIISESFLNILESTGESYTDIKKSENRGYRSLNNEGKIIIYKYIYNKYKITIDSLMSLDNNSYLKSKYYSIFKYNHELRLVRKLRKLEII